MIKDVFDRARYLKKEEEVLISCVVSEAAGIGPFPRCAVISVGRGATLHLHADVSPAPLSTYIVQLFYFSVFFFSMFSILSIVKSDLLVRFVRALWESSVGFSFQLKT